MMPDNNPFLEGYICAIRGKADQCPYDEGSDAYQRWWQGSGGSEGVRLAAAEAAAKMAAKTRTAEFVAGSTAQEGRRPFVEGYRAAILGGRGGTCPYEAGTPEYERWWKGRRSWLGLPGIVVAKPQKPITVPKLEGRRPFVEGYKSAILARRFAGKDVCPYAEDTGESEYWWEGFSWCATSKAAPQHAAHR